jgi:hypothetical protein
VWLCLLVLAIGAVKLVVQDVSGGTAASSFASLLAYGVALSFAPRLLRHHPA